jgi:hypothetical protein
MAKQDPQELRGEELDKRAADLGVEGRSGMTADEKRDAIADAEQSGGAERAQTDKALAAERDRPSQFEAQSGVPEGQQGPPEQDDYQPLVLTDNRPKVEARDRNMYVGLVHKTDVDADVSGGDYVDLNSLDPDETTEVDGTPVEDAQVIGGASGLVLILNGQAFHLGKIAGGVLGDLQHAALVQRNS